MFTYILRAPTEKKLKQALPNWLLDAANQPLAGSHNHTLMWGIETPEGGRYFYAKLQVADADLAESVEETLQSYLVPTPSAKWDIYA